MTFMLPRLPDAARARRMLAVAEALTARMLGDAALPAPLREGRMLLLQGPAWFDEPDGEETIGPQSGPTPVGVSPEPGGSGWYCNRDEIARLRAVPGLASEEAARFDQVQAAWVGRTTNETVWAATDADLRAWIPSNEILASPIATGVLPRMGGCQIDYPALLAGGLPGLRQRAEVMRQTHAGDQSVSVLADGMQLAIDAVAASLCDIAERAERLIPHRPRAVQQRMARLATTSRAMAERAPQRLVEAMQLAWVTTMVAGSVNWGRMDDWLAPFVAAELARGSAEDAVLADLTAFWRLLTGRKTTFNGRVILGGLGRRHGADADRTALLLLRAHEIVRGTEPQLTLRFHPGQDPRLYQRGLELIAQGLTYPMLYNDTVNVPAVAKAFAVDLPRAEHYIPFGCGEYILDHASVGTPNGVINLSRVLEEVLFGLPPGSDRRPEELPEDAPLPQFATYDGIARAFRARTEGYLERLARYQALSYQSYARELPLLLFSLLHDGCLERGRALLDGGVRHRGGTMESYGQVNAADSLVALRQVVFEQRHASLAEVQQAMRHDFRGHERLHARLKRAAKFGNDDPQADATACWVHELVCHGCRDRAADVGLDSWLVVVINNSMNTGLGQLTGATPDGRQARAPLANANGPQAGAERNGPTAVLTSQAKPDPTIHAGAVQHLRLSRAWFQEGTQRVRELLDGYWARGGAQCMISVSNPGELIAAMERPADFPHLLVRVGGFSARFVELPRAVQAEVASRACH